MAWSDFVAQALPAPPIDLRRVARAGTGESPMTVLATPTGQPTRRCRSRKPPLWASCGGRGGRAQRAAAHRA